MRRNNILTISILWLSLMSGCASSTQDLVEQAQLSGDWTLVNIRMAAIERREAQSKQSCPRGTKRWCISRIGRERCSCVSDSEGRDMFRDMFDTLNR